jgi:hypothetical protein
VRANGRLLFCAQHAGFAERAFPRATSPTLKEIVRMPIAGASKELTC